MANEEQENKQMQVDSQEPHPEPAEPVDINDTPVPEASGWLMKRSKISHKWKRQWFHLKNTELHYGYDKENLPKRIPLVGSEISESTIDDKTHTFRVRPKDSKRVYYIQAENEEQQHEWMQAICFAKATGHGDKSEACVLQ